MMHYSRYFFSVVLLIQPRNFFIVFPLISLIYKYEIDTFFTKIYPQGIRHIRADRRVNEWRTPGNRAIVKATTNKNQVVIALTGGEIVYFELDNQGQLNEYQERRQMNVNVNCLAVGEVPEGRKRAKFLVCIIGEKVLLIYGENGEI